MFKFMKKMTFFACAAMLASAVAFTGCNNEEPQQKPQQVTTDIAISLPDQVVGMQRMPGKTVQTAGATDFSDNGMNGITLVPFAKSDEVTTSSVRLGDNIVLGAIGGAAAHSDYASGRAAVFTGQSVPQGTSAFLFYGESGKTGTGFEKGILTASLTGQPSAFTFSLSPINANAGDIEDDAAYKGLIAYLNAVANAKDSANGTAWKDYTAVKNEGYYELFQTYSSAKTLSSFAIRRMMTDLYQSLMTSKDTLAVAIRDSIADARFATVDGSGNVTLVSALQGFPASFNLPDGAVAVTYASSAFGGNAAYAYGDLAPAQLDRYVYPASLWYTANTQIKTSTTSKAANYSDAASWKAILATYEKDNSSVNTKTRSIALKDTIQYAVARLDVMVKFKENTYLEDNDPVAANNKVNNPASGYPLSAVLVGGQKNVGFDFTQASYAGSIGYAYTIYDKEMTTSIAAVSTSAFSAANSTLVLETPAGENEYIALEFTNTSTKDFYGVNGIVPVGAKFYLVGQLTASAATETETKVFKQDYTTTARVAIKDLKSAYSTIPDLKAPQIEIGLSVDLSWQAGHTYELEL